jgi:hypothetical protein
MHDEFTRFVPLNEVEVQLAKQKRKLNLRPNAVCKLLVIHRAALAAPQLAKKDFLPKSQRFY